MNPFDALIEKKTVEQRREWMEPVKRNGRDLNTAPPKPAQPHAVVSPFEMTPPMSAPCDCGARYGMHRVKDFSCPNPNWRPGNGQNQWRLSFWKRA